MQALEGLNRLTKGLTLQLCTVKRPVVGERLVVPLQAALSISQVTAILFPHTAVPPLRCRNQLAYIQECMRKGCTWYNLALTPCDYPATASTIKENLQCRQLPRIVPSGCG